ncbi:hypothetical protein HUJ04_004869 [Dendroctonus ponderosae]|uniref:Essential protein Yae1 N-terminal domain-containing protein n=1 Tax=Dendroctonus ponderosae TaxID=77166 RepID=A0AAR5NWJ4_DENPD|nr:hypothetical protein HUJ04_004869 [Dendroctonus ponderosae]
MPNTLSDKIQEVDINDVFDDILFSEEKVVEKGYQQGFAAGSSQDSVDGYHLGYHRGAEIGSEIGFYQAFSQHYLNENPPEKVLKNLEGLSHGCCEFPRINCESTDIFEAIEKLRGLYKKIATQLKIKSSFKKEGIQF